MLCEFYIKRLDVYRASLHSVQFDENLHCITSTELVVFFVIVLIGQVKVIHVGLGAEDVANFMTGFFYGIGSSGLPLLVHRTFMRVL